MGWKTERRARRPVGRLRPAAGSRQRGVFEYPCNLLILLLTHAFLGVSTHLLMRLPCSSLAAPLSAVLRGGGIPCESAESVVYLSLAILRVARAHSPAPTCPCRRS